MMDRIYREARQVVSWLGEDSYTGDGMHLLEILANIPSEEYQSPSYEVVPLVKNTSIEQWLGLGSLLSRPYFKRAWVVQEVALAKEILLVCGDRII